TPMTTLAMRPLLSNKRSLMLPMFSPASFVTGWPMNWLASHCPAGCTVTKLSLPVWAEPGTGLVSKTRANGTAIEALIIGLVPRVAITSGQSCSSHQSHNERDDKEDDEHPEQHPGGFHSEPSYTAKSNCGRDERNYKEYNCVVQEISHFGISITRLRAG